MKNAFIPFIIVFLSYFGNGFRFLLSDFTSVFIGGILALIPSIYKKISLEDKTVLKYEKMTVFLKYIGSFYTLTKLARMKKEGHNHLTLNDRVWAAIMIIYNLGSNFLAGMFNK